MLNADNDIVGSGNLFYMNGLKNGKNRQLFAVNVSRRFPPEEQSPPIVFINEKRLGRFVRMACTRHGTELRTEHLGLSL